MGGCSTVTHFIVTVSLLLLFAGWSWSFALAYSKCAVFCPCPVVMIFGRVADVILQPVLGSSFRLEIFLWYIIFTNLQCYICENVRRCAQCACAYCSLFSSQCSRKGHDSFGKKTKLTHGKDDKTFFGALCSSFVLPHFFRINSIYIIVFCSHFFLLIFLWWRNISVRCWWYLLKCE